MSPARRAGSGGRRRSAAPEPSTAPREILAWEDDPLSGAKPVRRPPPTQPPKNLALAIVAKAPPLGIHEEGTAAFRYWTGIEALCRGLALFAPHVGERGWAATRRLRIHLDRGRDLNAYYDRESLSFFHDEAGGRTIYSGESPDVVTHELGHAILDALRPQLWDVMSLEAAAFHESFGDLAALLTALELPGVRAAVLAETGGRLFRTSRLSRLAESLGFAIRQSRPDLVPADCLRNAVNAFFYRPPVELPPSGPDATLTSEPHSFSRVFTAGAFEALALLVAGAAKQPGEKQLLGAARDLATLLVHAVLHARIVPGFFAEVATKMLEADHALFGGRHGEALRTAFVRRGLLSLESAMERPTRQAIRSRAAVVAQDEVLPSLSLAGDALGLGRRQLVVRVALSPDAAEPREAARAFLEYLLRRGRVDFRELTDRGRAAAHPRTRKTHVLARERGRIVVVRRIFDCGLDPAWG